MTFSLFAGNNRQRELSGDDKMSKMELMVIMFTPNLIFAVWLRQSRVNALSDDV